MARKRSNHWLEAVISFILVAVLFTGFLILWSVPLLWSCVLGVGLGLAQAVASSRQAQARDAAWEAALQRTGGAIMKGAGLRPDTLCTRMGNWNLTLFPDREGRRRSQLTISAPYWKTVDFSLKLDPASYRTAYMFTGGIARMLNGEIVVDAPLPDAALASQFVLTVLGANDGTAQHLLGSPAVRDALLALGRPATLTIGPYPQLAFLMSQSLRPELGVITLGVMGAKIRDTETLAQMHHLLVVALDELHRIGVVHPDPWSIVL